MHQEQSHTRRRGIAAMSVVVLVVVALAAAGCGTSESGSGEGGGGAAPATEAPAPAPALRLAPAVAERLSRACRRARRPLAGSRPPATFDERAALADQQKVVLRRIRGRVLGTVPLDLRAQLLSEYLHALDDGIYYTGELASAARDGDRHAVDLYVGRQRSLSAQRREAAGRLGLSWC
jgi:hypothetical protein